MSAVKTQRAHESHARVAATLSPTMTPQVSDSTVMLLPIGVRARFVTPKCTFIANSAAKAHAATTSTQPKVTARGPRSLTEKARAHRKDTATRPGRVQHAVNATAATKNSRFSAG